MGGTVEFEELTAGINGAISSMQKLIAETESRMDAELETARAIQEAALPRTFPPFPDIMKFDIYATMNAARQIGGDFYDFFLIGDDCDAYKGKLGFLVADVSGKGVPAALFMMKAKALLRDYMTSHLELGEAVSETNRQLLEGNEEGVFVTAWVGVLDYGTGHVDYVNAGHNPPLLWQRDGGWRWLKQRSGPMLGNFDRTYRTFSVDCKPGDMFLLYTDGVTEAFDTQEKMFGTKGLLEIAERGYRLHPRELLESVRDGVNSFSWGAEQSDDITILTLEVGVPPEVTASLEVPALLPELERVNDFLHAELDRRFCPSRVQNKLDIAVEEFFTNICCYAYKSAGPEVPRTVLVQRTYSADPPSITVDLIDRGVEFDPLKKPDAVTPKRIEDVPIGGLGILMAKKSVDEISYERSDGRNILTIVKRW
ncbi:MAG: SpoIIE family protein phosphatase [Coriobacteriales bacterium]|nr:SpoIIE family protein phosphatase [Coriobacteriales bacterium]